MRTLLAISFGLVLLITGCGGTTTETTGQDELSEQSTADTGQGSDSQATNSQGSDSQGSDSQAAQVPQSLDDYLGLAANIVRGGGGGAAGGRGAGGAGASLDEDAALEQQRLVQQEIQVCMQAQGFTYTPEETGDGLRFFLATQSGAQDPLEYAETSGFGISTQFDVLIDGDVDLAEQLDPNGDYVATLSDGEADAWQLALRGAPPERNSEGQLIDPETGEVLQGRGATGGCQGQAQESIRGDSAALAELAQSFDELEERIAADPRVAEIGREWVDCMGGQGFDFQDEPEARAEINTEFRPLLRSFFQAQRAQDQDGQGQGQGNRLQAIVGIELTAEQEDQLQALQDRERAVAVASVICQGDTSQEVAEIEAAYELEFVDTNRDALEALAG